MSVLTRKKPRKMSPLLPRSKLWSQRTTLVCSRFPRAGISQKRTSIGLNGTLYTSSGEEDEKNDLAEEIGPKWDAFKEDEPRETEVEDAEDYGISDSDSDENN